MGIERFFSAGTWNIREYQVIAEVNGKLHWRGTGTHRNGDFYHGWWENGKRHGQGTCTYANGDLYEGEWVDDTWSGVGQVNKTYVTVTPLLFVNSNAFVNMIHVHTDTPLGKC
jgi:hypothetical protein